jgi:undecaprenyl-diphosphatase
MIFLKLLILLFLNVLIEFLPISSTAHGILINKILMVDFNLNLVLAFSQLAISLSVCFYFRKKIIELIKSIFLDFRYFFNFSLKILITMLPTLLMGVIFYKYIKKFFYTTDVIAINLLLGSFLMFFAEKKRKNTRNIKDFEEIDFKTALKIGLFQCISLIPGVSRSASTISAGLLHNLPRNIAVDFSFFISIPVSIAASVFDIYKNIKFISYSNVGIVFYCFFVSLIFSCFFAKVMIGFLKNNKLNCFVYYRIIVGLLLCFIAF